MGKLENKTALITGASRGIGKEIAQEFASQGAIVGINYPPGEKSNASKVLAAVDESGSQGVKLKADVRSDSDVKNMIADFEEEFGPIDILVNNAGGSVERSPIENMSTELWENVVDLNLKGVFLTSKFAIPGMRENKEGSIINISSQLGIIGAANRVHYCAAKGGVISLTRALAREVAPEIRVNAIAPGPIETGIRGELTEEYLSKRTQSIPLGRLGKPEEVASTAAFLASDESSYFTGQTLSPDGGEAMH